MIHTNCKIIGLTGGIASGKSTVSKILREKGYKVIDSDLIAREIVEKGQPAYFKIIESFGQDILMEDKTLNREKIGELVFNNEELLEKLNQITHPYIFKQIKKRIKEYAPKKQLLFVDIPLLFEVADKLKENNINFDETWLVYVDEATQVSRLMKRNHLDIFEAKKRISLQMPMEEKVSKATKILDNRGDNLQLKDNIENLLKEL